MGNFDFLRKQAIFKSFADIAIKAEPLVIFDPNVAIVQCRKALESATTWLYSADKTLEVPAVTNLVNLLSNYKFRRLVGEDIISQLHILRKAGNNAAHNVCQYTAGDAIQLLNFLFNYLDWIDQNYGGGPAFRRFSKELVINQRKISSATNTYAVPKDTTAQNVSIPTPAPKLHLNKNKSKIDVPPIKTQNDEQEALALKEEIENYKKRIAGLELQVELNTKKEQNQDKYTKPDTDISEAETRKFLIDERLKDAGWKLGKDWLNEVPVSGMPTTTGTGRIDYALYGDDGKVLAIIEAKSVSHDPREGRHQAELYRKCLIAKDPSCDPVIFLTNGHEILLHDGLFPQERQIATFFSKEDLISRLHRKHTKDFDFTVLDNICGRYYQIEAIQATSHAFENLKRKALLVMATGTGKTRTVLGLIKALTKASYVKNVLFLADRTALVNQAFASAKLLLKDYPLANLSDDHAKPEDKNVSARIVFSTYPAMMNAIDNARNKDNLRIFTPGHFDLIICDEAHRSIYNRYQAIFEYFDSLLVGLTATPKDEIDRNTYSIFDLSDGDPTYYYSYERAVEEGYLVDYHVLKYKTDFMSNGIHYSDLSDDDKLRWEETFGSLSDENDAVPTDIPAAAINKWVINEDTIRKVLNELMTHGLKIQNNDLIGKTIIFAKNHKHAEAIKKVFDKTYPSYGAEFCTVIDHQIKYHDHLIEEFKKPKLPKPQIAVSVDMLDTGIDVPECLNLVFFKPVYSHAKFWQMIGRGTRCCKGLIDGSDKKYFLIVDACRNFEFFEENEKGMDGVLVKPLIQRTFETRLHLLHSMEQYHTHDEGQQECINEAASDLADLIKAIDTKTFGALSHSKAITHYSKPDNFKKLDELTLEESCAELGPLLHATLQEDISIRRFDNLMFNLELAFVTGSQANLKKALKGLRNIADELLKTDLPQVKAKEILIRAILDDEFSKNLSVKSLEALRKAIRELAVFVNETGSSKGVYITDFEDQTENEEYEENYGSTHATDNSFDAYKARLERYVRAHINEGAIAKLHTNQPLNKQDLSELEEILWDRIGSREEYQREYQNNDFGLLIRKIVGLDERSAQDAFANFLTHNSLNAEQSAFLQYIIKYIVQNGFIDEPQQIMQAPYDPTTVCALFGNDVQMLQELMLKVIPQIKQNAQANEIAI